MDFEKATGNYIASEQESATLEAKGKLVWTPEEAGDLIDLAALAATRLTGTDLSEYPLSAAGMQIRFDHEAKALRIRNVLSCLKRHASLEEDDYRRLSEGL